jgi:hypothetical protein
MELLEAIREFLKTDVLPILTGNERYHLQVALNALGILARELDTGAQIDLAESQRLSSLLGVTDTREELNRILAMRIRNRQLTYNDGQLMDHLMQTTLGKMSIDNPNYATYLRALGASRSA